MEHSTLSLVIFFRSQMSLFKVFCLDFSIMVDIVSRRNQTAQALQQGKTQGQRQLRQKYDELKDFNFGKRNIWSRNRTSNG
jgi:hypothetical protein